MTATRMTPVILVAVVTVLFAASARAEEGGQDPARGDGAETPAVGDRSASQAPYDLSEPEAPEGGRMEALPRELEGIGVTERLNAQIPPDLEFVDDQGRVVHLGEIFRGERPIILNLVYYTCPMLCTLVLNGVVDGMKQLRWDLGSHYEAITVTIDPTEMPPLARAKKEAYVEEYDRPGAAEHWHFLTGTEENIRALSSAVGFNYRLDEKTGEYIHTAATFILTPDGRVSRYLYGIEYEQQTLRLALLEASEGKIGNTIDRIVLFCFHYDASSGRYAPVAVNIMRIGGALSAVILGSVLAVFWRRERQRRRIPGDGEPSS